MAVFAVSFRIYENDDFQDRYGTVLDAIEGLSSKQWSETTSFYLIESEMDSSGITESIISRSNFSREDDVLLVIDLNQKSCSLAGRSNADVMSMLAPA